MFNLIEFSDNYSKTFESLRCNHKDEATFDKKVSVVPITTNLESFKKKFIQTIHVDGIEAVEIAVPLEHLNSFWEVFWISLD